MSRWQGSVATGAGEIDGADKRDRYQKNQGGQKSKNDHDGLLKNCERELQATLQRVRPVFSMGYIAASVHGNRQKRTVVGCNSRQLGTGTRVEKPALVFPSRGRLSSALAESNRAISCVNRQWLPAAVHLPVNLGIAEASFYGDGNAQADVPVARAGVNIGLEVGR